MTFKRRFFGQLTPECFHCCVTEYVVQLQFAEKSAVKKSYFYPSIDIQNEK